MNADALLKRILHIGLMHGRNDAFCQLTDRHIGLFGAGADGVAGGVFSTPCTSLVSFTQEL